MCLFLGNTTSLQQVVKVMFTIVYDKVWINGNTHGVIMLSFGVKQRCPLSPTLINMYIDEFEACLNILMGDSVFN